HDAYGVAGEPRLLARPRVVAQVQDKLLDIVFIEARRRHRSVRDAVHDEVGELVIGEWARESAAAKIDTVDQVAILAMALCARGGIDARVVLFERLLRANRSRRSTANER